MVFHCYSFSMVLGFIYLSLFYVGKSWKIILGTGMGELSCMVPLVGSRSFFIIFYFIFPLPLSLPMPASQSNLPIHQMEMISLGSTCRDTMSAKLPI